MTDEQFAAWMKNEIEQYVDSPAMKRGVSAICARTTAGEVLTEQQIADALEFPLLTFMRSMPAAEFHALRGQLAPPCLTSQ
jgi:hypothetical protein